MLSKFSIFDIEENEVFQTAKLKVLQAAKLHFSHATHFIQPPANLEISSTVSASISISSLVL